MAKKTENWKKENQRVDIKGFWTREGSFEGILLKKIHSEASDSDFYLVKLIAGPTEVTDKKQGELDAKKGDVIGVSASAMISSAFDDILTRGEPFAVKVVSNGKKPHPKNPGQTMWDMDIFSMPAKELGTPF